MDENAQMDHELGTPRYVRFTTFRRSGEAVPTPVWFAADGDSFVFNTAESAGKVKRLRHTPRVEVAASDMRGKVADGAPVFEGTSEVLAADDPAAIAAVKVLAKRYGMQWKLIELADSARKLIGRPQTSVIIRTTLGARIDS